MFNSLCGLIRLKRQKQRQIAGSLEEAYADDRKAPRCDDFDRSPTLSGGGKHEFTICNDISNGNELYQIPALSYKRRDNGPEGFHYVAEFVETTPQPVNRSLQLMQWCICSDGQCRDSCRCTLIQETGNCYGNDGNLADSYNVDAPEAIFECNPFCSCNAQMCTNRVIQRRSQVKVALFRTKSRGWGVRVLQPLARGTFIGVYAGELISTTASYQRADDTYLFNLGSSLHPESSRNEEKADSEDLPGEQQQQQQEAPVEQDADSASKSERYICDAKFYGNFTRFINHSCEPNLIAIRSYTEHQDERFPYISFFTHYSLAGGSELTLNYGDNYWLVKCKRDGQYCQCKADSCKFSRKTFAKTYKLYEASQKKRKEERAKRKQQDEEEQQIQD